VTASGTVNAVTTSSWNTGFRHDKGNIRRLQFQVKKGQLIARIDPSLFEAQVDQAKANVFTSKANLAKSEVSAVDTKATLERNKNLFAKNLIARSDLDTAETNYYSAVAQSIPASLVEQASAR